MSPYDPAYTQRLLKHARWIVRQCDRLIERLMNGEQVDHEWSNANLAKIEDELEVEHTVISDHLEDAHLDQLQCEELIGNRRDITRMLNAVEDTKYYLDTTAQKHGLVAQA